MNSDLWDTVCVKISNDSSPDPDVEILSAISVKCQLAEVRKSLLGYNYVATIVIHK